jgi:hypothetical protein
MPQIRPSILVLVAVNLIPLAGVLFFGWSVFAVVVLFWAENLVIGILNVARMLTLYIRKGDRGALGLAGFFAMHFGIFTAVHGVFVFALFAPSGSAQGAEEAAGLAHLWLPLLALAGSHLLSFFYNYLGRREWEAVTAEDLMLAPYGRVVALHVAILVGAFLVEALGQPVAALALLVVIKIAMDVAAHAREHDRLEARVVGDAAVGRPPPRA